MTTTDRPLVVSVVVADGLVGSFGLGRERRGVRLRPPADGPARASTSALVAEAPGVLRTDTGIPITVEHGLERLARSDIVSITAWELFDRVPSPALLDALPGRLRPRRHDRQPVHRRVRARRRRPARRQAGDHPLAVRRRARRPVPAGQVDPTVLYVDNGRVLTGAGTAAGVDTLLHLVRREWGAGRGQRAGPRDGRAAAPRRRPGPVHRRPGARLRGRPARRRPGVGARRTWPRTSASSCWPAGR